MANALYDEESPEVGGGRRPHSVGAAQPEWHAIQPEWHAIRGSSDGRPSLMERALAVVRVDFPPERRQPQGLWLAVATAVSIVGSLAAGFILVTIGTTLFPGTKGYVHFRFSDYGKLTVVGVVLACVGWPIATWISSAPRWLFLRLAIAVTGVLLLPDLWIVAKGQPVKAVLVLMAMHLAVAFVTYNALVHVAPATRRFRRIDSPSNA